MDKLIPKSSHPVSVGKLITKLVILSQWTDLFLNTVILSQWSDQFLSIVILPQK